MKMKIGKIKYPGGPLEILVNNTKWAAAISEVPDEGTTEVWEIINLTADTHPMHTHLVQVQLQNRQSFNVKGYNAAYAAAFPALVYTPAVGPPGPYNTPNADGAVGGNPAIGLYLMGAAAPPLPNEAGWKDTVQCPPGMVTRFVARFAPQETPVGTVAPFAFDPSALGGAYVWHCHIVDHEDNEMMRPYTVTPMFGAPDPRPYAQGVDY
jgi:FtsP/CotA-like multicopper oxidase with cupredoxin domain